MFSTLLLSWYDGHRRELPFRGAKDPYRIWVSEIMLQQTRTETVGAYYERFISRFPDVFALAEAGEQEVLKAWEGLGYYSRARNLHRTAKVILEQYGGEFPADLEALRALPGVGDYTAAAVASIAFDLPCPAMDGNLTRVLSRFHGVREDVGAPSVKRRLLALAREDMPPVRCGDFNQALMDLGATVCLPGTPDCADCPLRTLCDACKAGDAEELPVKAAQKPPREIEMSVALVFHHGTVWMRERKEALLQGLWVYALTENPRDRADTEKSLKALGIQARYRETLGKARHVFTHRVWNMTVEAYEAPGAECRAGRFVTLKEMRALPMPTAMKVAREFAEKLLTPAVCPAAEADLPALGRVYSESWSTAHAWRCNADFVAEHTPERLEAELRAHQKAGRDVYGLWLAGRMEGVMVLDRQENELMRLYVHSACQRRGLGRAAMEFAVAALDKGRDMKVTVLTDNLPAIRLYEAFGFCRVTETHVLNQKKNTVEEVRVRFPSGE